MGFDFTGIGSVADLAGNLVERFFPKKMDEAEKAKVRIEMQAVLQKRDDALREAQKSIIVAEMQQADNFTKRARPSIVYAGLAFIFMVHVLMPMVAWIFIFFSETPPAMPQLSLPGEFWAAWGGVCSIWVIGRSVEKRGAAGKLVGLITGS